MKSFLLISILFSQWAYAQPECPNPFEFNEIQYCAEVEWLKGEVKQRDEFFPSEVDSPFLNPMGEVPQRWIYSQAIIRTWLADDAEQTPVLLDGFRIFPFMHMNNGHNHSTYHEFTQDPEFSESRLTKMAFQSMHGYWTLRWTTGEGETLKGSQELMKIEF